MPLSMNEEDLFQKATAQLSKTTTEKEEAHSV